jgi:hypothetical protein
MKTPQPSYTYSVLVSSIIFAAALPSQAVTLISDSFDSLASGTVLNGRTPDVSLSGGNWISGTTSTLTGTGANTGSNDLAASFSTTNSASIDLGSGYFITNPGIYDISITMTLPNAAENGWVGFGLAADASTTNAQTGNNGQPWFLQRANGSINVYGGATSAAFGNGTNRQLTNGSGPALTTTTGTSHVYTLRLDTTASQWTLQFLLDGALQDLNTTGSKTYTYASGLNPLNPRYLQVATSPTASGTALIENISFSGPPPVPEPSSLGLLGIAGSLGLFLRRNAR